MVVVVVVVVVGSQTLIFTCPKMYGVGYWIILFLRSVLLVAKCEVCIDL